VSTPPQPPVSPVPPISAAPVPTTPPSARDGRCGPAVGPIRVLVELVYELLDAHADTVQFAFGHKVDREWTAHLHYLHALQREGRRLIAQITADHST
jgi:hypothetical protein